MTMDSLLLLSLAERVEAASGADRELDALIYRALAGNPAEHWYTLGAKHLTDAICPQPTGSLDAAMRLVPEGYLVSLDAKPGSAAVVLFGEPRVICPFAATPALALTAASLRALATKDSPNG